MFSDYLQVVMTTQNGPDVERRTRECVSRADIFFTPHPHPMAQPYVASHGLLILVASRSHSGGLGRTPLDESSARCRDLDLTTLKSEVHAPDVIRTRNHGKRAALYRAATEIGMHNKYQLICWKITPCIPVSTTLHDVIPQNKSIFNSW